MHKWIQSYVELTCGAPPQECQLKLLWSENKRWKAVRTGLPVKELVGWGVCFKDKRTESILQYAEKVRIAYYQFLLAVDWESLDGEKLRSKYFYDLYDYGF